MALTKERIEEREHTFTKSETFELIRKWFVKYDRKNKRFVSKYYARCCQAKVGAIYANERGTHDKHIDEFFKKIGEYRNMVEFFTFSERDITQEVVFLAYCFDVELKEKINLN